MSMPVSDLHEPASPEAADPPASPRKARRTARDREIRRRLIFARLQEGWTYDEIAETEGLTRERIRQIVVETLERRAVDPARDHTLLQIARLDAALRLAAEKVAAGELRAVDRLVRVLDRLDRYHAVVAVTARDEDEAALFDEPCGLRAKADRGRRADEQASCEGGEGENPDRRIFRPASG